MQTLTNDTAEQPIEIDVPSHLVAVFLHLIYQGRQKFLPAHPRFDIPQLRVLLGLADKLMSESCEEAIMRGLSSQAGLAPMEVFALASQRENLTTAKAAIREMKDLTVKMPWATMKISDFQVSCGFHHARHGSGHISQDCPC
jgi:hypothetical protein